MAVLDIFERLARGNSSGKQVPVAQGTREGKIRERDARELLVYTRQPPSTCTHHLIEEDNTRQAGRRVLRCGGLNLGFLKCLVGHEPSTCFFLIGIF